MTDLTQAVKLHKENPSLDLMFENLTDQWWSFNNSYDITFSDILQNVEEDTGLGFGLEVRYIAGEDENYIRFHVDNGCGDTYDVVFDKSKRVEVE